MDFASFKSKLSAFFLHFGISISIGVLVALLVFGFWFPYPYSEISGGVDLFLLVILVDICCGPLLTFVVFNNKKPRKELIRDLGAIGVIQLAALIYGLYSVSLARPIYLVFEVDRFRVVTNVEIDQSDLAKAKAGFESLDFTGPKIIAARRPMPTDTDFMRATELAMQGIEISQRPEYWISYDEKREEVLKRAKSINDLIKKIPDKAEIINSSVKKTKFKESELKFLPLQGRNTSDWIVLINSANADVVGFAHVDGFIEP